MPSNWGIYDNETISFPERHTGINIAEKLKVVGEDGRNYLNHKQASNMVAAKQIDNWQRNVIGKAFLVLLIFYNYVITILAELNIIQIDSISQQVDNSLSKNQALIS